MSASRKNGGSQNPFDRSESSLAQRIAEGLTRLGRAARSAGRRGAHKRGFSSTQCEILTYLDRNPGASLSHVATALGITRPTACDAVYSLMTRGFVEKRRSATDRRSLDLVLTESGRAEAESESTFPESIAEAMKSGFGLDDLTRWMRGLQRLLAKLESAGVIGPSRQCLSCRHFLADVHSDPARPHRCQHFGAPMGDQDLRFDCEEHRRNGGGEEGSAETRV